MLAVPANANAPDLNLLLDAAAAEHDPAHALKLLAPLRADRMTGSARLDLITARDGLAVDVALTHRGIDPRGKAARHRGLPIYGLQLRRRVGLVPPLAAIERRLIAEQRRTERQAAALFDRLGITDATTGARYARLWGDDAGQYADTDVGRDALVRDMNALLPRLGREPINGIPKAAMI